MNVNSLPRFGVIATAVICGSWCFLCAGCGRKATNESPVDKPAIVKVELVPEESDIGVLTHVYNGDGDILVETRVSYRDGRTGVIRYNPDTGAIAECSEYTKAKKLRSHAVYKRDGKTLQRGELYRPDGTLKLVKTSMSDGLRADYYWIDGKFVFFSDTKKSDDSVERTIFHADGTRWARSRLVYLQGVRHNPTEETVLYSDQGKPQVKMQRTGPGRIHEFLRLDGTVSHRQVWRYAGDSLQHEVLESVLEFAKDGKTLLRSVQFAEEKGVVRVVSSKDEVSGMLTSFSQNSKGSGQLIDVFENPYTGQKRSRFLQDAWVESVETVTNGITRTVSYKPGEKPAAFDLHRYLTFPALSSLQAKGWQYDQVREWARWDEEPVPTADDIIRRWYYGQSEWLLI